MEEVSVYTAESRRCLSQAGVARRLWGFVGWAARYSPLPLQGREVASV
jgi:hypothetical protein